MSFFLITISSCGVRIPDGDSVPPTLKLQNVGHLPHFIIKSEDSPSIFDTHALQLARNREYTAIYSFNDMGGIKQATMEIPSSVIFEIKEPLPESWTFMPATTGIPVRNTRTLVWRGDNNNPLDGWALTFTFTPKTRTPSGTEEFQLVFSATDYAGNTTIGKLTVRVGGGPVAIVPL
ncbi:hypothetical protein [Aequorivita sublithincola]|uniref:hypothetical protein n=1 Tax=Aequorivita sublithincola TaxID=101385 RepID=UPI0012F97D15|nr:hypothetical protein [Aequorivita sublithincola]